LEPPDALEKRIRFGCGFVFGVVIAGISSITYLLASGLYIAALCVLFGVVSGLAAMKYGDEYWLKLGNYWWWPFW
jgi:hypothetical protein